MSDKPASQDDARMQIWLTARPQEGDILVGMDRKTDAIFMDAESALRLAQALQDAVMMIEGPTPADQEH